MPSTSRQYTNPIEVGIGDQTLGDVKEMLCRALEMPNSSLTGNEALADLRAWDSLAVLNLMAGIDARYSITLSPETILACDTVRDVAMLVSRRRESG
jgi:acyl carrier protein